MKHITNVLVHSNRCEVLDGHLYTVGDSGLPNIRLKFLYLFEVGSLQGMKLECKYILPNGQYSADEVIIDSRDEVTFPLHYSCFVQSGWTTLKVTLVNGQDRFTLDDIIIKCKSLELEQEYNTEVVIEAINLAIDNIDKKGKEVVKDNTKILNDKGNEIKQEISNGVQVGKDEIQELATQNKQELETLRGTIENNLVIFTKDKEQEITDFVEENKEKLKGKDGPKGDTGDVGPRGQGITNIEALNENQVKITYGDDKNLVVEIPTIQGPKGEDGEDGRNGTNGVDGVDGVGIASITYLRDDEDGNKIYSINLSNGNSNEIIVPRGANGKGADIDPSILDGKLDKTGGTVEGDLNIKGSITVEKDVISSYGVVGGYFMLAGWLIEIVDE